jgi:hypothetical protein
MVVSDTTVERVLKSMDRSSVRDVNYQLVDKFDEEELFDWKTPSGKKIRFGIIDGSMFGNFSCSVLSVAGCVDAVVDIEPSPGRGHELATSRRLIQRAATKLGKDFFDIIAADGLYPTRNDFLWCRQWGCDLLVKTQDETSNVIQDARCCFFAPDRDRWAELCRVEGIDHERGVSYEVIWAEEFSWQDMPVPLTVAWVRETFLKPQKNRPEVVEFWILTTARGFSGEDLREMGHRRWRIENGTFKRLNALVGSKRCWSHNPHVCELLLRMWMMGLMLLGAYIFARGIALMSHNWKHMKRTWHWVTRQMMASVWHIAAWQHTP